MGFLTLRKRLAQGDLQLLMMTVTIMTVMVKTIAVIDCGLSVLPGAMLGFILSLYKLPTCMSGINIPILPLRKEA